MNGSSFSLKIFKIVIFFGYFLIFYSSNYEYYLKKIIFFNFIIKIYHENPFFTIMIPNFNKSDHFISCFNTIFCQKFSNFEIVVVDDFSRDDSIQKLYNLSYYLQLKIIKHKETKGTLASRIDAAKSSIGKYLISLDPDDQLECDLLEELYKYLKSEKYDILQYHYKIKSKKGIANANPTPVLKGIFNKTELYDLKWETCSLWKICFKRNVLLKGISIIPSYLYHIIGSEDLVIFFSVLIFCNNFRVIDYFGYIYTYNNQPHIIREIRNENYKTAVAFVKKLWKSYNLIYKS